MRLLRLWLLLLLLGHLLVMLLLLLLLLMRLRLRWLTCPLLRRRELQLPIVHCLLWTQRRRPWWWWWWHITSISLLMLMLLRLLLLLLMLLCLRIPIRRVHAAKRRLRRWRRCRSHTKRCLMCWR